MEIHLITERRILPKTRKKILPRMTEMKTRDKGYCREFSCKDKECEDPSGDDEGEGTPESREADKAGWDAEVRSACPEFRPRRVPSES